jgi:hypothetical protein
VEDFTVKYPECSKLSVDKKIKEGFVKDKRGDDPRPRYYVSGGLLGEVGEEMEEELRIIAEERLRPIMEEII